LWHKIEEKEGLRRRRAGSKGFALLQAGQRWGRTSRAPSLNFAVRKIDQRNFVFVYVCHSDDLDSDGHHAVCEV
jgi:hypothetical protein